VGATTVTRRRLDTELVRRGLASSRAEAREAVRAGLVLVAGAPASKVGTLVAPDAALALAGPARRFVSRGGEKLAAALARFPVDPAGRDCLDAGASTGGFTDCLLQAGARRIVAVDVGYGQLAWRLRTDARVIVLERTNVRQVDPDDLPFRPEVIVADLSFISLRAVMPALKSIGAPGADAVVLVKPQFEAGPAAVGKGGVVREPGTWARVLADVAEAASIEGLAPQGLMASPVVGPAGNVEFLLWMREGARPLDVDIDAVVREGLQVRG
jgi:23S rRNA (cytidine1920-2'-O)/16S rRNA (cytidine1409-2'-O)-methyltransferase